MKIGNKVRMTAENSNWVVGETGTITEILEGEGKVVIAFDGREDDYTAFVGDFEMLGTPTRQQLLDLIETTEGGVSLDYQTCNSFRSTPFRLCNAGGDVLLSGELDMTTDEHGFLSEFTEALFGEFRDDLASVTEYKSLVAGIKA
jgi:hypothetical protein